MLNSSAAATLGQSLALQQRNSLTRADIWLCVVQSVCHLRSPPGALTGLKLESPDSATPHADTLSILKNRRVVCACTHYPVFKEPTSVRTGRTASTNQIIRNCREDESDSSTVMRV